MYSKGFVLFSVADSSFGDNMIDLARNYIADHNMTMDDVKIIKFEEGKIHGVRVECKREFDMPHA